MTKYPISNHPLTGLKRKVEIDSFSIQERTKEIHFFYIVYFFNAEDVSLDTFKAPITGEKLTADNTTFVDAQGNYVAPNTEGAVGEFDFWVDFIENNVFKREEVYERRIEIADFYKRFD